MAYSYILSTATKQLQPFSKASISADVTALTGLPFTNEPWKLNSNSYPSAQCSRNQGAKHAELAPSAEKGRKFPTIFCEHLLQNASGKR